MMFKLLILAAAVNLPAFTLTAQEEESRDDTLTLSEVTSHVRFLASDELMGRKTGEPTNDIAARYIAEQFRAAGLSELEGAPDFLQEIAFEIVTPPKSGKLALAGEKLQHGENMVILDGESGDVEAELVYCGYGRSTPTYSEDDYGTQSVNGKIVVTKFGTPKVDGRRALLESRRKRLVAKARGAVGVIELYSGPIPWAALTRYLQRPRIRISDSPTQPGEQRIFHVMIDDRDGKFTQRLQNDAAMAKLQSGELGRKEIRSSNVVGMVRGTDLNLRDEYVLLAAHFDHVGAGLHLPGATPADSIFNGAGDNATGTVAVISAAKMLAQAPPARSVIFMATTAEEEGLLGSRYYVENPLVPLRQTVFVLNSDGGGMSDPDVATILGLERTTAAAEIRAACAAQGLEAIPDPVPEMGLYHRSDNAPFARVGIPAITFSPGFKAFDQRMRSRLHKPSDEADVNYNFEYLLTFCKAYSRAAQLIANQKDRPTWTEGGEYKKAAEELYGER